MEHKLTRAEIFHLLGHTEDAPQYTDEKQTIKN